jgi:hypothetical protein
MVRTSIYYFCDAALPLHDGAGEHYRRLSDNRLINTWHKAIASGYAMPCFQAAFNGLHLNQLLSEKALAQSFQQKLHTRFTRPITPGYRCMHCFD